MKTYCYYNNKRFKLTLAMKSTNDKTEQKIQSMKNENVVKNMQDI